MKKQNKFYIDAFTGDGFSEKFYDMQEALAWLCDATSEGGNGYVLVHEHEEFEDGEDGECSCVQYLTDHHPVVVDGKVV